MGINHLNKILKKYSPDCFETIQLESLNGKKIAIDTSLYMYKYKVIFGEEDWLRAFCNLVCCFRKHDIHPIFIFDSQAPPEKLAEQMERREQRQKLIDKLTQLKQDYKDYKEKGSITQNMLDVCEGKAKQHRLLTKDESIFREDTIISRIDTLQKQTISINKENFELVKEMLKILKVPFYDAVSEAEALGAYLSREGRVEGVMTSDTDVLAYGVTNFFKDIDTGKGTIVRINMERLLGMLEMTQYQFRDMCIMCGTDYNKNIPRVGPMTAYSLMKEHKNIDEMEKQTKKDVSILKHHRVRELFSFENDYYTKRIMKCGKIDINKVRKFLFKHNCNINIDYVEKCFIKK
jgi:flap endonuclease-1